MGVPSSVGAGFAQHYPQTFFPAAYPRWYPDGFGQMFSTLVMRGDGVMEYGRGPEGAAWVLERFGCYPLVDVLNGSYLRQDGDHTRWTPVHAWMLTHFLFFSPTRNGQLRQYLHAIATGMPADRAVTVFGDLDALAKELRAYYRAKKPYERMTYPADRIETPTVRRLTRAQAAFVKGRLELGSWAAIPPLPPAGLDPAAAARLTKTRTALLIRRDRWLQRLRKDAATFPTDVGAQLLLAEAECRVGNAAECRGAADRTLTLAPGNGAALTWKGIAITQQAQAGPADARAATLREARATIAQGNRADTEAVLPLLGYYRSYAAAGQNPPDVAIDGLAKSLGKVPNAPSTRLAPGTALAARGNVGAARSVLRPVVMGAYDPPEKVEAQAVMSSLPPQ